MLALRLTRAAHPAVHARRLAVAAASAGTGFLLLSTLGHALTHPDSAASSALRLAWCAIPLTATVHFAMAVARTDPATRPRPGLAAIGLGPARLMAVSATTTALSTLLGSMLALLVFLHLRGDLTGLPFDGAATTFLAATHPLPLPAALTLLSLTPLASSAAVALMLRPRDTQVAAHATHRAFGGFTKAPGRETFGSYGRFGARGGNKRTPPNNASAVAAGSRVSPEFFEQGVPPGGTGGRSGTPPARASDKAPTPATTKPADAHTPAPTEPAPTPTQPPPTALPWGAATLAAGLAVEAYAARSAPTTALLTLPAGLPTGPAAVLLGWTLTAVGLALAGPGLTHLCGRLLQTFRPGALRLLAGRGLMEEASRIGRPLGILCAVVSGAYTMATLNGDRPTGPLSTLGALLVTGCALGTLLTAAVESRQHRADTTAALVRLGAPAATLRGAAALRAGALLLVFTPLTLTVAQLATLPLAA
ncbi:hypothetical protein IAG44_10885 [Streptomyces roseirectus]|uniref:Uncharacterized protein n=1 Tax=Streptomyces roseirectus TaxID=2768066 RepID=A0A7H0IAT9_9ACTN|nr:hypothetical protein [Streptomyces roseirectus]QNP69905.1 hypothetical protein IAG44_10885 [Streptomyces roseirectus]